MSSAPGHLEESAGQAVGQPTDPTESRQDVGKTSSFPLTRRPARTPCYLSKGTPGARVSKVIVAPHTKGLHPCTSKTAGAGVMVQRNDQHKQSPRYRASSLPKIGEDDVDWSHLYARSSGEGALLPLHKRRWHAKRWCRLGPRAVRRIKVRERRHTRQAHATSQHDMF